VVVALVVAEEEVAPVLARRERDRRHSERHDDDTQHSPE